MASRAQTNGVLPIPASQTAPKTSKASQNRAGPSLKVVVRRLAPALTEAEFMKIIGEEWKVGAGRVDWFSYKPGKVSTDPSKASRPSRAYLHLINEPYLTQLSNHVRQLTFEDAAKTFTNPCLLGPASLEYTPYARIPSGKRRTDARQGTIDLDPEFMDFLESLANPTATKEEDTEPSTKGEKVTTTPLVQYLKDKKANKSKEAAAAKAAKQSRLESQSSSASGKSKSKDGAADEPHKKTPKDGKRERLVEKAAREAVRVLNRESSKGTAAQAQPANAAPTEAPKNPRAATRERGSIAAAARILQRDLGLSPVNAHRRAKVEAGAAAKSEAAAASAPQGPKAGPSNAGGGGKGKGRAENNKAKEPTPAITLLKKPVEPVAAAPPPSASPKPAAGVSMPPSTSRQTASASQPKPPSAPSGRKPAPSPVPTAGATRAFVKHANPSQGVTEPLLREAMTVFGAVTNVEIDKRKGFAYVDFADGEGLRKAVAANPTKIAQGTVVVLERKDTKPAREAPAAGARGGFGGGGGRGGGAGGGRSVRRGRGGRGAGGGGGGGSGGGAAAEGSSGASASATPAAPTGPAAAK